MEMATGVSLLTDTVFMKMALEEARLAAGDGEIPVGAVVVRSENIVARGHNEREKRDDPTAHAEILALRRAGQALGDWRLEGCDLYVTLEPCLMCAGAAVWSRIRRLVFAASDPKAGAVQSLYEVTTDPRLNHQVEVEGGVMRDASSRLLKRFFRQLRSESG